MTQELKRMIDQICKEKKVDKKLLISAIEDSLKSAIKKRHGNIELEVSFNETTGIIEVYQYKTVVERVRDNTVEISLKDAQVLDPESQIGDSLGINMDISNLGRIAAQAAKQVITQKMKNVERDIIFEEFRDRIGEIVNGIILRLEKGAIIINLGRTEAIIPPSEQLHNDNYRRGDKIRAYIAEVRRTIKDPQVVLSRTHPNFLLKLLEMEVPEISEGIIRVMSIAREAGSRSKISVASKSSDIDPVGACVGVRGTRVQSLVQELKGERIDIIQWNPDPAKFVYNALSPAECSKVIVDDDNKTLEVVVPDDQLSIAIGKQGQNVRLVSKLMGWKIDVKSEKRFAHYSDHNYLNLLKITGISESIADRLYDKGFISPDALIENDPEIISNETSINKNLIISFIENYKKNLEKQTL